MENEARGMLAYDGEAGPVQTYLARPRGADPRPAVIVIHEIMGLTDPIKRVADRFAPVTHGIKWPRRPSIAIALDSSNRFTLDTSNRFTLDTS